MLLEYGKGLLRIYSCDYSVHRLQTMIFYNLQLWQAIRSVQIMLDMFMGSMFGGSYSSSLCLLLRRLKCALYPPGRT